MNNAHEDTSRSMLALGNYARMLGESRAYRLGNSLVSATDLIRAGKLNQLLRKTRQRLFHGWTNNDLRSPEWKSYVADRVAENELQQSSDSRSTITVYTCITGGYDSLMPPFPSDNDQQINYVAFVDDSIDQVNGWQRAPIPDSLRGLSPQETNRYIKLHPQEFCSTDYSIYIDGNLWLLENPRWMCDVARRSRVGFAIFAHGLRDTVAKEYEACLVLGKGVPEGLKKQYDRACALGIEQAIGLYEAPILVSDLKNSEQAHLYDRWWREFSANGFQRDQLALPCALSVCGFTADDIGILGTNVRTDARILRREHEAS